MVCLFIIPLLISVIIGMNSFYAIIYLLPKYILSTYLPEVMPIAHTVMRYSLPVEVLYLAPTVSLPIILAVIFSISLLFKLTRSELRTKFASIFYLIIATPTLLSVIGPLYAITGFLLPSRNIVLLYLLSYPLISRLLLNLTKKITKLFKRSLYKCSKFPKKFKLLLIKIKPVPLLLIALVFMCTIFVDINIVRRLTWYKPSINDIKALEWINENVNNNELILNDASFISLFLQGYSIKNLSFWMWTWNARFDQTCEMLNETFENTDLLNFYQALLRYNVSYVFLSSEKMYLWRLVPLSELPQTSKPWKYSVKDWLIIDFLDDLPFLKKVFAEGGTKIYQVLRESDTYSLVIAFLEEFDEINEINRWYILKGEVSVEKSVANFSVYSSKEVWGWFGTNINITTKTYPFLEIKLKISNPTGATYLNLYNESGPPQRKNLLARIDLSKYNDGRWHIVTINLREVTNNGPIRSFFLILQAENSTSWMQIDYLKVYRFSSP